MATKKSAPSSGGSKSGGSTSGASKSGSSKSSGSSSNSGGQNDPMLQKLFYDELKDIYYAEKLLAKSLPKMRKAATTEELKAAFEDHTVVTKNQIARLEQVFELLGKKAQGKRCDAMEGLTKEAEGVIEDTEAGTMTRDVALVLAAQKAEHYEIATYGGLAQLAKTMGLEEVKNLLGQTLDEEKEADSLLSTIAENNINYEANNEGEEED